MCQGLVFYHLVFPFLCPNNYSVLFTFPLYSYTYEPLTHSPPPPPPPCTAFSRVVQCAPTSSHAHRKVAIKVCHKYDNLTKLSTTAENEIICLRIIRKKHFFIKFLNKYETNMRYYIVTGKTIMFIYYI